jgi:pimeloyl-ACP methyl ester carboxylesterase
MKMIWLTLPGVLGGCAAAAADPPSVRLTAFRTGLARDGWLRDVEVDGRRYCVADRGRGEPLVLLHGVGGSIYDWRHVLRPLSRDRRVIAIDLLGAGESDKPAGEDYSVAAQARRVRGVLEALGVERASLAGNSFGGGVALRFAQDWPERTDRLVLLNSICYAEETPCYLWAARLPGAERLVDCIPTGQPTRWVLRNSYGTASLLSEEELDSYIVEMGAPGRRRALVRTLRDVVPPDVREFESRLRTIRAPALLVWGKGDRTVPIALGRRLAAELPDARLVELDAGHVPNQEKPEEVVRLMREFLP